jgi:hypothetical protein
MSIDPHLVPATLDLFHVVLGVLVLILVLLTLVLALLPLMSARHKQSLEESSAVPAPAPISQPPHSGLSESQPTAALQLLSLLQQEARFIDFIEEDLQGHPDDAIGAAARVVHEGCRKLLKQYVQFERVVADEEGARVTLEKGFNPAEIRITGHIVGAPPFIGRLVHKGWKVRDIRLPLISEGHDSRVIAPAEVEL